MESYENTVLEKKEAPLLVAPPVSLITQIPCGRFSFFSKPVTNIHPRAVITPKQVYQLLTGLMYAHATGVLRTITDKERARAYKAQNFDYTCFSGIFSSRGEKNILKHSGFIVFDFDHLQHPEQLKKMLVNDPNFETVLAFISPSGHGLKWVIKIYLDEVTHLEWFMSISVYIKKMYNIDVDQSGKDVSRCCFLCYDPDAYLNPKYL